MALIYVIIVLIAFWLGWRFLSRRKLVPCPAWLGWVVDRDNPFARAARSENIVRLLGLAAGARVADIGCGPGRVTIPLAKAVGPGGQVIAMDVQEAVLEKVAAKTKAQGLANIRLVRSDARDRALQEGSFDGVVLVMALGEIPQQEKAISRIHALLKNNGRLLIAESVFDPHFMNKDTVRDLGMHAGFVETKYEGDVLSYAIVFEKPSCA
ncbi:MAG TPA: methyltransferase domain-containing protein [Nitrospirota bacterium]|nr:methyltransferase domain-containing protein [Nitrospirota bacterium]